MADKQTSSIFPVVRDVVGWTCEAAGLLGVPGASIAGKLIQKVPVESLEKWMAIRAADEAIEPKETITVEVSPSVVATDQPAPEDVQPQSLELDIKTLLQQYQALEISPGFLTTIDNAISNAISRIGEFVNQTVLFSQGSFSEGNGLWPIFVIELIVRRSLSAKLGKAAVLVDKPELHKLIESELAKAFVDDIATSLPTIEKPLKLASQFKAYAIDTVYQFPKAKGFRSGFVIGNVSKDLFSAFAATQEKPLNSQAAAQVSRTLTARLYQLGTVGRDELTDAWFRTVEASELSNSLRMKRGLAINPFLSILAYAPLNIEDTDLLEETRPSFKKIYDASNAMTNLGGLDDFFTQLDELTLSYANNDVNAFEGVVKKLNLKARLPSLQLGAQANQKPHETVRMVINRLRLSRGWD